MVRSLHLTAVVAPPLTDTLLPAQVQSPGRASLLTLARGESGDACAIVQESRAGQLWGLGHTPGMRRQRWG